MALSRYKYDLPEVGPLVAQLEKEPAVLRQTTRSIALDEPMFGLRTGQQAGLPWCEFIIHIVDGNKLPSGERKKTEADAETVPVDPALLARLCGGWRDGEPAKKKDGLAVRLWRPVADDVLPGLAATGAPWSVYHGDDGIEWGAGITFDGVEEPYRCVLQLEESRSGGGLFLSAVLVRGTGRDDQIRLAEHVDSIRLSADGWLLREGTLSRFEPDHAAWLETLSSNNWRVNIPSHHFIDLLTRAGQARKIPPLLNTECLRWTVMQGIRPVPVLEATSTTSGYTAQLLFDYGNKNKNKVVEGKPGAVAEIHNHQGHLDGCVIRDLEAEAAYARQLRGLAFHAMPLPGCAHIWSISFKSAPAAFASLIASGWRILVPEQGRDKPSPLQNPDWSLQVSSGIDWFDLQGITWGDMDAKTSVSVFVLLECIRKKQQIVQVPGEGAFLITPEIERTLQSFAAVGKKTANTLRLNPELAGLLMAVDPQSGESTGKRKKGAGAGELMQSLAESGLKAFSSIQPSEPPSDFRGELRPYQKDGLGWLHFLRRCRLGGCLADDMGLGKTVQVIALLADHHAGGSSRHTSLIVAPLSLLGNWLSEFHRFAPSLKVHVHHGPGRLAFGPRFEHHDVVITTYGLVHSDQHLLGRLNFEYVVLDEAHQIRNADAKSSRAVKALACRHRLALTGTPLINYGRDLKSLFDFLSPGLFHSIPGLNEFVRLGGPLSEEEARRIGGHLRPFILRRTKSQVLEDLPEKTEQVIYCELQGEERATYNGIRDQYRRELLQGIAVYGMNHQRMHVLAALMRLRQLACHPGLIDPGQQGRESAKITELMNELEQALAGGHKALVFSNFTGFLDVIRRHLVDRGLGDGILQLTGKTKNRQELVDQFQNDPAKSIFLISIKAGGVGLNLTAADYVFIADPWWNVAIEQQAIDRVHRIGQKNAVFAYRLIARDTIEEKMLELQKRKAGLLDFIIDEKNSDISKLTPDDLEYLLS